MGMADVANPLKPWKICKAWASRILAEFFAQGDEEKRLGLPVGLLNDRDKVNGPSSQHGFISFLVSPLVTTTVSIFPALQPLAEHMADNLETWRDNWMEEAERSQEDLSKRDAEVQKVKDTVDGLSMRSKDLLV